MTTPPFDEIRRRHFIVVGTSDYEDPRWATLDVGPGIGVWRGWLTDDELTTRRFNAIGAELDSNPTKGAIRSFLSGIRKVIRPSDAVVVVLTGHGEVVDGDYQLVLRKSRWDEAATMQRAHDILNALRATEVQYALIIIDSCHAGRIAEPMVTSPDPLPDGWMVLAAAAPTGVARVGAVSRAVQSFLAELDLDSPNGSYLEEYLGLGEFASSIANDIGAQDLLQLPRTGKGLSPCLPNPVYREERQDLVTTTVARRSLAIRAEDLASHWSPKSRGVSVGELGWF